MTLQEYCLVVEARGTRREELIREQSYSYEELREVAREVTNANGHLIRRVDHAAAAQRHPLHQFINSSTTHHQTLLSCTLPHPTHSTTSWTPATYSPSRRETSSVTSGRPHLNSWHRSAFYPDREDERGLISTTMIQTQATEA